MARTTRQETLRRKGTRERVLARLRRGSATNIQLSKIALRFGARIFELRKAGYTITPSPRKAGVVRYTLA